MCKHRLNFAHILSLAALLCGACTTLVIPVEPGAPAHIDNNHGIVFGRIVVIWDIEDPVATGAHVTAVGWQFRNLDTGKRFIAPKVTRAGWYVLDLPSGQYEITQLRLFHGFTGEWEGKLPATFTVSPRECLYVGTWTIRLKTLGQEATAIARVYSEPDQFSDRLNSTLRSCPSPPRTLLMNSSGSGHFGLLQPSGGG